jgi:hypothetical protein
MREIGITAHATMPGRLELFIVSFCSKLLIQMNSAGKIVSAVEGLNPKPLGQESSALTTRLLFSEGWV